MANLTRLLAELADLEKVSSEPERAPEPVQTPPLPVTPVEPAADLETAARRLKEQLPAIQEIVTTADKTAPLKRFIWLGWGAVQSLVSNLDGVEEEIKKKGAEIGKDTTMAVQVLSDLRKLIEPLQDAIDSLNTVSKG